MKVLFSVSHFGFLRNFEPALHALADQGHTIRLLADRRDSIGGMRTVENLMTAHPSAISYAYAPSRKTDTWLPLAVQLRLSRDYWRYLEPRYARASSLRGRAAAQAPRLAATLARMPIVGSRAGRGAMDAAVRRAERALPPSPIVTRLLEEERPDVLLITPLLYFGSSQVDFVRAARQLAIPCVLGVGSWDHLTTKGLIHAMPDRVLVWNEAQRQEAWEIHGIPPERVVVTGAQAYDHWFRMQPSTTRASFCAQHGFDPALPLLLYLCSSPFIAPHEVPFVERWIGAIRGAADPRLRRANVLVRPHPQNAAQWAGVDLASYGRVAVWPRAGANPVDADARRDYFDSMHHSVAVVGVNTSALIESGIVGRPVCSVHAAEFEGQQEGTLHFQHLKNVNGGLLHVASDFDEHLQHLGRIVASPQEYAARSRAFIEGFVRPHGIDVPAAPLVVRALKDAAASRPSPATPPSVVDRAIRTALAPAARAAHLAARRRKDQRKNAATAAVA